MHPTSLPGNEPTGSFGKEALNFINFLADAGQRIWQTLPLGPTHGDLSPYQCLSSHAGNPVLIDLSTLVDEKILSIDATVVQSGEDALTCKRRCIRKAWAIVEENSEYQNLRKDWAAYIEKEKDWLHDYALFIALRNHHGHSCWLDWPEQYRQRDLDALNQFYREFQIEVDAIKFEQYLFDTQWLAIKKYANEQDIELYGDLPIFVALDSADVWCRRELFLLDENGRPEVVAGVPPDYFSETGQRWGNPLYDWAQMEKDNFSWWVLRLQRQLALFDKVRIDHFRGFEAYWSIPADEETAMNGHWVKAPGEKLFNQLQTVFSSNLPFIAEDLGIITPEVDELRIQFNLPGMKILQFAFDGDSDNPYLPHNHIENSVVYTGTHDNDTIVGWFNELPSDKQKRIYDYCHHSNDDINWLLIEVAMASVANTCIFPLQDVLGLDSAHRMNTPATVEGNWRWRFDWKQLKDGDAGKLKSLCHQYDR